MGDHLGIDVVDSGIDVVDSEEIVEMTVEMTGEEAVVELASIAIELGTWQEIVPMATVGRVAEEVVLEEKDVVGVAGHATIATERDIWPENAQRVIAEIVEGDRVISFFARL